MAKDEMKQPDERSTRRAFLKVLAGVSAGAAGGAGVNALSQTIGRAAPRAPIPCASETPKQTPGFSGGAMALTATMGAIIGGATAPHISEILKPSDDPSKESGR